MHGEKKVLPWKNMQKPDEKQESMTNYGWHALKNKKAHLTWTLNKRYLLVKANIIQKTKIAGKTP